MGGQEGYIFPAVIQFELWISVFIQDVHLSSYY